MFGCTNSKLCIVSTLLARLSYTTIRGTQVSSSINRKRLFTPGAHREPLQAKACRAYRHDRSPDHLHSDVVSDISTSFLPHEPARRSLRSCFLPVATLVVANMSSPR